MQRADIGIICVTDSELNAIRSAMSKMPQFLEEERFTYYSAQFDGNDCKHRVVMTYSTDQGNVSAAISVAKFLTKYRPRLMVMVGMAGGISDELKLLDVAISTEIIYYEPRKERDSAVSSRLQVMPISTKLRRVVRSFKADLGAPASVLDYIDDEVAHSFRIYDGPFGTGEAIVGSKNSAARATVLNCNDKALVVETEAWGVHKAVFEDEDCKGKCRYALTIKGVADNADSEKDESRQYRASRNAFETLRALLSTLKSADLL